MEFYGNDFRNEGEKGNVKFLELRSRVKKTQQQRRDQKVEQTKPQIQLYYLRKGYYRKGILACKGYLKKMLLIVHDMKKVKQNVCHYVLVI